MAYDERQISRELTATALGQGFFGNALRVAKDIPGMTADDRAVLDRFATGNRGGTDHVRLQDIANRIWAPADSITTYYGDRNDSGQAALTAHR